MILNDHAHVQRFAPQCLLAAACHPDSSPSFLANPFRCLVVSTIDLLGVPRLSQLRCRLSSPGWRSRRFFTLLHRTRRAIDEGDLGCIQLITERQELSITSHLLTDSPSPPDEIPTAASRCFAELHIAMLVSQLTIYFASTASIHIDAASKFIISKNALDSTPRFCW